MTEPPSLDVRGNAIPLARFAASQDVDYIIHMDASDFGICALFPDRLEFVQVPFYRKGARGNRKNEQTRCFMFWSSPRDGDLGHVRFWIDNNAAIAWNNRRYCRNPLGQLLLRLLSLLEVQHGFYASAAHIPGVENVMADTGSRIWQSSELASRFTNLSSSWSQVTIPPDYRDLWKLWGRFCDQGPRKYFNPDDVHGNAAQLGAFAVYLWQFGMNKRREGNTYSTICGKLCGIRWYHKSEVGYDPGVSLSHAILLRGIRRFTDPVIKQHTVSAPLLRAIAASMDFSQAHDQLLWGGILLAYFFLLRRSEYLFIGRKRHNYILKLSHIRFFDAKGIRVRPEVATIVGIMLQGAKNNQFGREECRFHSLSGDPVLCPVRAAYWIINGARAYGTNSNQPALSGISTGITAAEVSRAIKLAATRTKQDPSRFSTH